MCSKKPLAFVIITKSPYFVKRNDKFFWFHIPKDRSSNKKITMKPSSFQKKSENGSHASYTAPNEYTTIPPMIRKSAISFFFPTFSPKIFTPKIVT